MKPYTGRCWRFGDDLASDEMIAPQHVFEYDPKVLRSHLLEGARPEFSQQAVSGDILVAGRNFATGSIHSHPFLALKDMNVALICQSVSRGPFRLAIYIGIPILIAPASVIESLKDADQLEVDFSSGRIRNNTSGQIHNVDPVSPFLLEIVTSGGGLAYARSITGPEGVPNA